MPRNPIIAKLFRLVKLSENIGFGFDKIETKWLEYNETKPIYELDFDSVIVIFKLSTEEKVGEKVGENLTDNQREILVQMRRNSKITAKELALLIGISDRKVEENISKLKKMNFIKRMGSFKGGHWEVTQ
ncbi:MAG: winged helix-turn-helix transcriptional regulator [Salinivirgaceae bacterium]